MPQPLLSIVLGVASLFLVSCNSLSDNPSLNEGPSNTGMRPAPLETETPSSTQETLLPAGFDVQVTGEINNNEVALTFTIDIPSGSYIISATSDRNYLGKFQVAWEDSLPQIGAYTELPPSTPGWEPWDRVYTPMLQTSTVVKGTWQRPARSTPLHGTVQFVLEPQCMMYGVDFSLDPSSGSFAASQVQAKDPE